MLSLSAALARRILPQLSEEAPRSEGLRTWIGTGSFYVDSAPMLKSILLKNVVLTELIPFVSYDYERFALSSMESLLFCGSETSRPQALGWPAAKLYYAAFFGAHAVMRATGHAVLRLEGAQAARITQIASLYDPTVQLTPGTYLSRLKQGQQLSIDVELGRLADSGGAHDQFWRCFYSFLGNLAEDVASGNEPEATAVAGETSEIQNVLSAAGLHPGTWLSGVRNQITYQHKHGAWFPFNNSRTDAVDYVSRVSIRDSSSVRRDYNASRDPLLAFCAGCHLIALIGVDLGTNLCGRLRRNSRFEQLWNRLRQERPHV